MLEADAVAVTEELMLAVCVPLCVAGGVPVWLLVIDTIVRVGLALAPKLSVCVPVRVMDAEDDRDRDMVGVGLFDLV